MASMLLRITVACMSVGRAAGGVFDYAAGLRAGARSSSVKKIGKFQRPLSLADMINRDDAPIY